MLTPFDDIYFMKLDSNLNVLSAKKYFTAQDDYSYDIIRESNGELIIDGITAGFSSYFSRFILKLSDQGALLWAKLLDEGSGSSGFPMTKSTDGNYLFATASMNIFKADSVFNILAATKFTTGFLFKSLNVAAQTRDGGLIAAGAMSNVFNSFVIKMDSSWNGGCNQTTPSYNVSQVFFGEDTLVLTATTYNIAEYAGPLATYAITNPVTTYCQTATGIVEGEIENNISVFPNPFTQHINVNIADIKLSAVRVLDVLGNAVAFRQSISDNDNTLTLHFDGLKSGIYILQLTDTNGQTYTQKIACH